MKVTDLLKTPEFEDFCYTVDFNARMVNNELELSSMSVDGSPCFYFSGNDDFVNFNEFLMEVQAQIQQMSDGLDILSDNISDYQDEWENMEISREENYNHDATDEDFDGDDLDW